MRPKRNNLKLDSMTVDEAKDQKIISGAKKEMYMAEIQRIKALEASKSVIDTQIVNGIVMDVFSKMKTILYSATNNLPAQLAGKEHAEIVGIMFKFIDETLERVQEDFNNKITNIHIDDEEHD